MILLVLFRSLNDLCFLLVAFPARWPKLSRCERVLLEENIMLTSISVVLPQGRQTKGASCHRLRQRTARETYVRSYSYEAEYEQSPRRQISPPCSSSPAAPK
jgi:hypothetical protein